MSIYDKMTHKEFDDILEKKVFEHGVAWLFRLPGVWEIASEELNNDVLDAWASEQGLEDQD
jgi:hypothetical protein